MLQKYKIEILADKDWDKKSIEEAIKLLNFGGRVKVKKVPNRRTPSQNSTFYGWIGVVGNNANEMGLTVSMLYKEPTEILITPDILAGYARQVAETQWQIKHTSKLNTKQFSILVDFLEDKFATNLDNKIPFVYKKHWENS